MTRIAAYAGVLACAVAVTVTGITALPIDDHEAFVLQTAQEMRERGDWIVPHFNGRPRLKKPPFSYWATAALAEAANAPRVEPWHGRAPSVAGAVGLVALTMVLAHLLVGFRTSLAAGCVATTSVGLFRYAHSARPDMLYAFWCTAMLTGFLWNARRGERPGPGPAIAAWLCVGLATLTKGPQLPVILIGALVFAGWRAGWSGIRIARTLRPISGIPVAMLVALPWWGAVQRALPGGLAGTQLGGSLLTPTWTHILDPYFFYRPLALVLPSIAILAPAAWHRRWPPWDAATRLLVLVVLVSAALLSFGPQRRPHYMLPLLAPLAILVGRTIVGLRDTTAAPWATRAVPVVWAAVVLIDVGLGGTATLWSPARFETAALAAQTKHACAPTEPIIALGVGAPAASYEAHRRVRPVRSGAHLPALIDAAPNASVCVLATTETIPSIPDALTVLQLGPTPSGEPSTVVLLRVTR